MAMTIDPKTNLLSPATFITSPNFNDRPTGSEISLAVIHGISLPPGEFGGDEVQRLFTNQLIPNDQPYYASIANLKVSSHIFIRRTGEVIQFVPFDKRAWHAGVSSFQGKENCNDYSIGIELEGTDTLPYEKVQYQQLADLLGVLMRVYPAIAQDRIVGHNDIAPGRKTDPGQSFDWPILFNLLSQGH